MIFYYNLAAIPRNCCKEDSHIGGKDREKSFLVRLPHTGWSRKTKVTQYGSFTQRRVKIYQSPQYLDLKSLSGNLLKNVHFRALRISNDDGWLRGVKISDFSYGVVSPN